MSEQEISEYLEKVSKKEMTLETTEEIVAEKFRNTGEQIRDLTKELKEIDKIATALKKRFTELSFKMDVYTEVLIDCESTRRKEIAIEEENDK